jgi:hypothetical protein
MKPGSQAGLVTKLPRQGKRQNENIDLPCRAEIRRPSTKTGILIFNRQERQERKVFEPFIGCLLATHSETARDLWSCIFFFIISPLTSFNSPLKTSHTSHISEIVDTSGYFLPENRHYKTNMKTRILLGLCVLLGAGFISACAADNPAQVAARAALVQKLNELDRPPISAPPVLVPAPARGAARGPILITPTGIVKKPRCIYAAISLGKC